MKLNTLSIIFFLILFAAELCLGETGKIVSVQLLKAPLGKNSATLIVEDKVDQNENKTHTYLTLFLHKEKRVVPLIHKFSHPLAPFRDHFVFVREAMLFSLDLKTVSLRQLSVDTSRTNLAGDDRLLWNQDTRCLVFANNSTEKNAWGRVCLECALPETVDRQVFMTKSWRTFDSAFAKKYGLDVDKRIELYIAGQTCPQFQIEMEPYRNQRLVIMFMAGQGGYWVNSV